MSENSHESGAPTQLASLNIPDNLGANSHIGKIDKSLAKPPADMFVVDSAGDDNYAVERGIIMNGKKIGDMLAKLPSLQLLIENKRNGISDEEKKKIIKKVERVFVSQDIEMTSDNIGRVTDMVISERKKLLADAINRLSSIKNELDLIEDLPKNYNGSRGFFDLDSLGNMIERTKQAEELLLKLITEVVNC